MLTQKDIHNLVVEHATEYEVFKNIINALPDGYLLPFERE